MPNAAINLLTPDMQEAFWGALDPDMRAFLSALEMRENWTWQYEEMPELFTAMASALPRVVTLPLDEKARQLIWDLIPLITAMPFRQAVAALVWLDNRGEAAGEGMGWGVITYREASYISEAMTEHPLHSDASTLVERLRVLMRSRVAASLFCQLQEEVML